MKSAFMMGLILAATLSIREDAAAQEPSAPALDVEQIAFSMLLQGGGGCNGGCSPTSIPVLMDVNGPQVIPFAPAPMTRGAWSPDGTNVLATSTDIFVVPVVGGPGVNLTNHPATYLTPAWSPDGTRIAFASDRDGGIALYIMKADGSDVVGIAAGLGSAWYPTWSPDSARLAFSCIVDPAPAPFVGNHDICAINADGSGLTRLTSGHGDDEPDWSPDGSRIVFARSGGLAVMDPDGANVTPIALGLDGSLGGPNWSSDSTHIVFGQTFPFDPENPSLFLSFVAFATLDSCCSGGGFPGGAGLAGFSPTWRPWKGVSNYRPTAAFTFECTGRTCTFDGSGSSDSDGSIAAYGWHFDDGTASGAVVTHTFTSNHKVELIVMDDRGALAATSQNVNQPPVASFTTTCKGLTCTFDGSASHDPDGDLVGVLWHFGSPPEGGGPLTTTHTYTNPGTYLVTLSVEDSDSARTTLTHIITVSSGSSSPQNQIITFNALPSKTYGDPAFAVSATASSGLTVNFTARTNCTVSGNIVTIAGAGSCTIIASQPGDANYLAATDVAQTFSIAKANQMIAFNQLPDKTTSDPPFSVNATASSGLAVGFGASGNCTVAANTVTITGAGSCTITASQSGNSNFNPAPNVAQTFNITSGGGGPSAMFVSIDTTTQGSWQGVYGFDGYNVINGTINYPAYAQVTPSGQFSYTWASSTSDVRALQKVTNLPDRIAGTWYNSSFSIDLNLTDGNVHQVAFYVLDWDSAGRSETLEVHDAVTNALLDARTVTRFQAGQYVIWNLRGHVTVRFIVTGGPNAVLSGVFLGGNAMPPPPPPPSIPGAVAFVGVDTTTQGSWQGVYGTTGYNVINDTVSYPAFAPITPNGQFSYTWTASTSDVRALQKATNPADRIAGVWYGSSFSIDVNLTDENAHQVGFYVLDWDTSSRGEAFEVRDAVTNALLDTRTVTGFHNGKYLVWNMSGHVTVRVVLTAGMNAVVSGVFIGP